MQDATRHYINGQSVTSIDGREMAVEKPSTEEKVAAIILGGVEDADAAIAAANDAPYGLTNYAPTTDKFRACRLARRLRSGMVEMNGKFGGAGTPFGGLKQSGTGREGGVWGLEEFPELKAVSDWG